MTTETLDKTVLDKPESDNNEQVHQKLNQEHIESKSKIEYQASESHKENTSTENIDTLHKENKDVNLEDSELPVKRKKALTPAEALKLLKTEKEATRKSKTVLSKTRKDWSSFTKSHKLQSDLKLATKSKSSFLGNSDFLARTQQKKDDLAREARIKGMGKI